MREFLKEQLVLEPAEFRIARIVGEQRARAREHIFRRVAASIPNGLAGMLEDLLVVKPDETSSGFQAIKANPSKELDEQLCSQRQTIQVSLTALTSLGRIILDDAISNERGSPSP